jgi:hypothetical protein
MNRDQAYKHLIKFCNNLTVLDVKKELHGDALKAVENAENYLQFTYHDQCTALESSFNGSEAFFESDIFDNLDDNITDNELLELEQKALEDLATGYASVIADYLEQDFQNFRENYVYNSCLK